MKQEIIITIAGIVLFVCLIWTANELSRHVEAEIKGMNDYVGDTIIIGNDSLMITDYSFLGNHYQLSNGTQIGAELVLKQLIES